MVILKRNVLTMALMSALMAAAGPVIAQTTANDADAALTDEEAAARKAEEEKAAEKLDAIVVTGIRAGIERAVELKRGATSIVDTISAEDLGKLPDVSITESLSRLPGLAAQRVAGRSSTISIRGLSDDYGTTLLNGREQVSVGDNRGVEFDQFPAELINQVVVYKTPDAALVGQGLSGTIDLRTIRPLAYRERQMAVNVRGERNSLGALNADTSDNGSRVSAFYVDQFLDHQLGVAVGYARLDSPGQAQRYETWGFPTDSSGNYVIGGSKLMASSRDNVRQGLMGVVEYNVNDNLTSVLDVYYSKFEKSETTRFMETGLGWSGATLVNPVVRDGIVVSGTFNNVRPVLRNDLNEGDDKLFAIGWNNRWQIDDDWAATVDLSHSRAKRQESLLETYAGTRAGVMDNVHFELDRHGFPTFNYGFDYSDPARIVLTDPGGWGQDGYIKTPKIDDELTSFRASAERSFESAPFSSLQFGVNYADREKTRQVPEAFLDLINDETTLPASFLINPVNLGFAGVPGSISYRINAALAEFYQTRDNINADIVNKQWTVNEKITTTFAQLNIDTSLGDIPLRGNVGVQAVSVDQSSDGFSVLQGDAANAVPFHGGDKYTDFLPSMNLAFTLPGENVLRFGLGRQAARPRIDQMRANNNTSLEFSGINQGLWTRSGGNPALKPWIANALDLSWERYFAERGYVSVAYFFKDLRSYVYEQQGTFDASGLATPVGYTGPAPRPVGAYTRQANGEGGTLKGAEAAISVPFDLFSSALRGFGFSANFSHTSSSIKRLGPDGPSEPIAGLSKQVRNLSLYYEDHGFQARVSQRSRSAFLGEIQGFGADRAQVYIDGESVIDFQTGYTFSGGPLDRMSILLQVNNVTNEPYRQYYRDTGLTQRYEEYGRQYLLGVTYKF